MAMPGIQATLISSWKSRRATRIACRRFFLENQRIVRIGFPPMRVEVTNHIDGVTFEECHANRIKARVAGLSLPFIDLTRLRKNKLAAGRPKDLEDLRQLPPSDEV